MRMVSNSTNDQSAGYLGVKLAAGTNVALATLNPGGSEQLEISVPGTLSDHLSIVSGADTTPASLSAKIVAGANVTLTILNPGANETLEVAAASGVIPPTPQSIGGLVTLNGWASTTTVSIIARQDTQAKHVEIAFLVYGTGDGSGAASIDFTGVMPLVSATYPGAVLFAMQVNDNGWKTTPGMSVLAPSSPIITLYTDWNSGAWTNGNTKNVNGQVYYYYD